MLKKIFKTNRSYGVAILRLTLGILFFREGAMKLFGWFGGGGWAATCAYFAQLGIPFPEFNAWLVAGTEFFGGIALVLGLLTRLAAIPIGIVMITAILTAHLDGGWAYPLVILVSCLALIEQGAGALSADQFLTGGLRGR